MKHRTISLIGNRDLRADQIEVLRDLAKSALSEYTQDTNVTLLTSLAEGGDRLLAKVALEFNLKVVAVLPANLNSYRQDFPATVDEFDTLLERCDEVVELSGTSWPINADEYQRAARWMIDRSSDVVCICDPDGGGAKGGTLDSIDYAKSNGKALTRLVWIHCTRVSNKSDRELAQPFVEVLNWPRL